MIEFEWIVDYKCNYSCSYCYNNDIALNRSKNKCEYIPYKEWVAVWSRVADRYGEVKVIISGGEPTLYPDFLDLIIDLSRFCLVSFDTNFHYCNEKFLAKLTQFIPKDRIFMGISFHPEFTDLNTFMKRTGVLKKQGYSFRINYVTYPKYLKKLKFYQEIFTKEGFRFVPITFRGSYKGKYYPQAFTKKHRDYISRVAANVIDKHDSLWARERIIPVESKNRLCYAGQYFARVDCDGAAYRCGRDYSIEFGNILHNNFRLNNNPMLCTQEICPCDFRWIVND